MPKKLKTHAVSFKFKVVLESFTVEDTTVMLSFKLVCYPFPSRSLHL